MKEINERPVCHRAEDLVTYLYNEANEADARDFATHAERCDACRAELAVFQQVHESILLWRNEALGAAFTTTAPSVSVLAEATPDSNELAQHARRLSALGALREFFNVSPLWLRGATAFAGLLLCVLGVLAISRLSQRSAPVASNQTEINGYSKQQFDAAVANEVKRQMDTMKSKDASAGSRSAATANKSNEQTSSTQLAVNRTQPKATRPRGLTRQEREQLAADLRLIPRDDDELPFILSEEPNQ